ncbi:MAG: UvrB/UvrC motif-containing protein, partial [Bacilli bacterium]|nr:UvrB/UvrC motif-containing protein [Bacilli bacterium]
HGQVIMYADHMTDSMKEAITETNRRRNIQEAYNKKNGIVPETIIKEIRLPISNKESDLNKFTKKGKKSKSELTAQMREIEKEMRQAAKEYNFERAAELRDILLELRADNE